MTNWTNDKMNKSLRTKPESPRLDIPAILP